MTRKIAFVNEQTMMPHDAFLPVIGALQTQLDRDVLPVWTGIMADSDIVLGLVGQGEAPPPDAEVIVLGTDSDQPGTLGYHQQTAQGKALAYCFLHTDLLAGASPSVTIGHETLEMVVDPHLEMTFRSADGHRFYLKEVGDPVEDDRYGIMVDGVLLSDWTYPAFWSSNPSGGPYDAGGDVTAPMQILDGGYLAYYELGKGWTQDVAGQRVRKGWRFDVAQIPFKDRRRSTRWHMEVN